MRCNGTLRIAGRRGIDKVFEWLIRRNAPQASGFPFAQVVLNTPFTRLTEQAPWFPAGFGHHGHIRELLVGVLGTIPATECIDDANDLSPFLITSRDEGLVHQM